MSAQRLLYSLIMAPLIANGAITFESIESKTIDDKPVFNQVSFESKDETDIWKMRQSHGGRHLPLAEWDELMIKVDKKKRPFEVSYHQLKNGKEVEYKVSCYFCHSNGPRNIRPKVDSAEAPLTLKQRIQIGMWNFKMKTYGKVVIKKSSFTLEGKKRETPLKYFGKRDLEPLTLSSCTMCHQDSWWGRGSLTRQQALPIAHLVKEGKMPPWPFTISPEEKKHLEEYLAGIR